MKKNLIGIDLGGTTVKIAFLTWDGDIIEKWEIPTRTENNGEHILSDIVASIEEHVANRGISLDDFHAAGVGVPGPVQLNVGYLPVAVNLGGFGDININDTLGQMLNLPVITDNDANVAGVGEMWKGSGDGADNVVFITLGTGVGGGIVTEGHIISGFSGAAGEIGHMPIMDKESPYYYKCNCGASGCVETVCSATGIVRVAKQLLEQPGVSSSLLDATEVSAKKVLDAAKAGDAIALEVVDVFSATLARTMELLSVISNPEIFIIGGGVSKAGDFLIENIMKHYGTNIFPNAVRNVEVKEAKLGNDAGVYGAARHARGIAAHE